MRMSFDCNLDLPCHPVLSINIYIASAWALACNLAFSADNSYFFVSWYITEPCDMSYKKEFLFLVFSYSFGFDCLWLSDFYCPAFLCQLYFFYICIFWSWSGDMYRGTYRQLLFSFFCNDIEFNILFLFKAFPLIFERVILLFFVVLIFLNL